MTTPVLALNSVKDTTLWNHLSTGYANTDQDAVAANLASMVESACSAASERIKHFPYFHPEFTLHDERHLLRVTELMAIVLGEDIKHLNPIEVSLLILSAFYHDQGMVPDADEWDKVQKSPEFLLSEERWDQDHPNVRDIRQQLDDPRFKKQEKDALSEKLQQHRDAHRTSFLRVTHGERAEQLINRLFGTNANLSVAGVNLAPMLGQLCASHVWPASKLTDENGFRVDQSVGVLVVNLRFLALLLRLADILDFDRDRTPEPLLRTINISSPVSLIEWSKHRSVEGWEISERRIRFTLACEHPAYQKAAYEFMDAIDHELREAHRIVDNFPRETPTYYRLALPRQVERDRIEPKNNAYRYADLEFGLSRDEIIKLLMTDKLYSSNSLFVRELLQNSLDALRHRVATYGKGQPDWEEGLVSLNHFIDSEGNQVVRCVDNGIGMDESLVRNFLTNAGRSYYRSPEFSQQRIAFRKNSVDFDPCAQFGIGFMSCFMFGDQITIKTRRDYGPGRVYGEPLEIEISGLGGLLVIRDGNRDQPIGTTVEITGPRKPVFLDAWADDVRLCDIASGYALATEFPIVVKTEVEEIAQELKIPPCPAFRRTALEKAGATQIKTIEYELSKTDPRLGGTIRIGLLVNDNGFPCLRNNEAGWELQKRESGYTLCLKKGDENISASNLHSESATCMDGILICGHPGRQDDNEESATRMGWRGNSLDLGDPFLIDIRGDLKPTITPSRIPPEHAIGLNKEPTWTRISDLLILSHAKAWVSVLEATRHDLSQKDFWRLSLMHQVPIHLMPADLLWDAIHLPTISSDNDTEPRWVALSQIGKVKPFEYGDEKDREIGFQTEEGRQIGFNKDIARWYQSGRDANFKLQMLLLRFSQIDLLEDTPSISITNPSSLGRSNSNFGISAPFSYLSAIEYIGKAAQLLSVQSKLRSVNHNHPIVNYVQKHQGKPYRDLTDFQNYCSSIVWLLSSEESLTALAARNINKGRGYRRLGTIYQSIDWSRHDDSLAPPYSAWTTDSGIVEITKDDLIRWSRFSKE